jgi:hypothetical protein
MADPATAFWSWPFVVGVFGHGEYVVMKILAGCGLDLAWLCRALDKRARLLRLPMP